MNNKWVAPMVLSISLVSSSLTMNGQASAMETHSMTRHAKDVQRTPAGTNVPVFVTEKQLKKAPSRAKNAVAFLDTNKEAFNMRHPKKHFKVKNKKKDKVGMTHVRLQQTMNGVPVEDAEMIVHYDKKGKVNSVNGHYNAALESENLSTQPDLTQKEAVQQAKTAVSAPNTLPYEPTAELIVYSHQGENKLAYKTNINFLGKQPGNWFVYVNAHTGEVIDKNNALMDLGKWRPATGSGIGVLGDHRTLHISHKNVADDGKGSQFYLRDTRHKNLDGIFTYDFGGTWSGTFPGELYSGNDAAFKDAYDQAAVDAHYNSEQVYKYYKQEHSRNSIDGNGMAIISSVHYGVDYNNAFWNGEQMTYGDGDGEYFNSLSAGLDVAAHEMTHGVTHFTAGLNYSGQSGALNEAFSDIFGTLVDADDWEVGESIMADEAVASGRTSLRSLSNPSKYQVDRAFWKYGDGSGTYPSNMNQYYDLPLSLDNGGVHVNSSIINHAAYIIGTKIGKDKLGDIYYRALTQYLTPTSDFNDARKAVIQSAVDLYGETSGEVKAATAGFDQVGITG